MKIYYVQNEKKGQNLKFCEKINSNVSKRNYFSTLCVFFLTLFFFFLSPNYELVNVDLFMLLKTSNIASSRFKQHFYEIGSNFADVSCRKHDFVCSHISERKITTKKKMSDFLFSHYVPRTFFNP